MSRHISAEEEIFLSFVLKSYYKEDKSYLQVFIDFEALKGSVEMFLSFFENEDKFTASTHLHFIRKIFSDDSIDRNNCNIELGLSRRTFYKYKLKYLQVLKNYLVRSFLYENTS